MRLERVAQSIPARQRPSLFISHMRFALFD
jgi:hypothetical protein